MAALYSGNLKERKALWHPRWSRAQVRIVKLSKCVSDFLVLNHTSQLTNVALSGPSGCALPFPGFGFWYSFAADSMGATSTCPWAGMSQAALRPLPKTLVWRLHNLCAAVRPLPSSSLSLPLRADAALGILTENCLRRDPSDMHKLFRLGLIRKCSFKERSDAKRYLHRGHLFPSKCTTPVSVLCAKKKNHPRTNWPPIHSTGAEWIQEHPRRTGRRRLNSKDVPVNEPGTRFVILSRRDP